MNKNYFEGLFNPRGIAIIGVNEKPYGGGYFLRVLTEIGFNKPLYLFNPRLQGKKLKGYLVRSSISEIPDENFIDYAIIAIPAKICHLALEEAGKKGVKFVTIFSSGFSEVGNRNLEKKLLDVANKYGIRLLGPNCLGVYAPESKMGLSRHHISKSGELGIISQSGGLAINLSNMAIHVYGTCISKMISIGNQIDLNVTDFLEYFLIDESTKIIGIYLENIKGKENGRRFLNVVRKLTLKKKPVILWKVGAGESTKEAILSHTGGLAGDDRMWDAISQQTGLIRVKNSEELISLAMIFNYIPFYKINNNLGIVTVGGGSSIEVSEQMEDIGLKLPKLSREIISDLKSFLPEVNTIFRNPLDLGGEGMKQEVFARVLVEISKDSGISAIIFIKSYYFEQEFTDAIKNAKSEMKIPLICIAPKIRDDLQDYKDKISFKKQMFKIGVPVFESIDLAAKAIKRIALFRNFILRNTKF